MKREFQTRSLSTSCELREAEGKRTITGFIPYMSKSVDLGGFREYIAPTAFSKTLKESDVRALLNHDSSMLIGRVSNGSLRFDSQDDGLHIECDLPDTTYARDAFALIKGGYNNNLSFGFNIINEDVFEEDGEECRVLREVRLHEVSFLVTFPAYEETKASARSLRDFCEGMRDIQLTDNKEAEIRESIEILRSILPDEKPASEEEVTPAVKDTGADERSRQLAEFLAELREIH